MNRYEALDKLIVEIKAGQMSESGSLAPQRLPVPCRVLTGLAALLLLFAAVSAFQHHVALACGSIVLSAILWTVSRIVELRTEQPRQIFVRPAQTPQQCATAVVSLLEVEGSDRSDHNYLSRAIVEAMAKDRLGLSGDIECDVFEVGDDTYHVTGVGNQHFSGYEIQFMAALCLDWSTSGQLSCESNGLVWK
jgi:hypothetical protein